MITNVRLNIETIFKEAFGYWKQTLAFQLIFSLLYFGILFSVIYFAAMQLGIYEQYMSLFQKNQGNFVQMQKELKTLLSNPEYTKFSMIILATNVFLFPLNLVFYRIFKKIDLKQPIALQDLFAGYHGVNFFIYISFYLFWSMIYSYLAPTVVLGIAWVLITLFTAPLMFFYNINIFQSLKINFQVLKQHFLVVFLGVIIALFIKYVGIFAFGIGILFTFPFFNSMIYALFKNIFTEEAKNNSDNS
jgi:hypothetical protein